MKLLDDRCIHINLLSAVILFLNFLNFSISTISTNATLSSFNQFNSNDNSYSNNLNRYYHHNYHQQQTIGVVISAKIANDIRLVQKGYQNFLDIFRIRLDNMTVEFIPETGSADFFTYLKDRNYTTIIKSLGSESDTQTITGFCQIARTFSEDFNKNILIWPCPQMQKSEGFLPSYETISFAVKSVAKKLNWTEVTVLVSDVNSGLTIAMATNLHIPFRLHIGLKQIDDYHMEDKVGKAIIITTPLIDFNTFKILQSLQSLNWTKVLVIDIVASSFHTRNRFYQFLNEINSSSKLRTNLLVLTILTERYRNFLNVVYREKGIELVQNFKRSKRWKYDSESNNNKNNSSLNIINNKFRFDGNDNKNNLTDEFRQIASIEMILYKLRNGTRCNFTDYDNRDGILLWCDIIFKQLEICVKIPVNNNNNYYNNSVNNNIEKSNNNDKKYYINNNNNNNSSIINSSINQIRHICEQSDDSSGIQMNFINNATLTEILIEFFYLYEFIVSNFENKSNARSMFSSSTPSTIGVYDFVVLDFKRNRIDKNLTWRPFLILERNEIDGDVYTSHPILPGYNDWLLEKSSDLWHCGDICWILIAFSAVLLLIIMSISVAAGIVLRNYLLRKRLSKGPNKIVLSANDFIFPVDSRRVDEGIEAMLCCWLQQLQEFGGPEVDKPDLLKGSIGSLKNLGLATTTKNNSSSGSLARHNTTVLDLRARYNGDMVQLKEVNLGGSVELKSKAMDLLVIAHGLRHENINPLIGWLSDPNRTAIVFDYCSRGSLQDVLIMDEIKLDWTFRLSLLTDLVRGMRYLHSSSFKSHGALSSRNCVVDARWVLKVTDYGLGMFYDAQGIIPPTKHAKELLWTAPELLRNTKNFSKCGTQMGDVYSFGIIMQEVVVRGEPYCMLSLSPEEIINKIKKPPPLIRPSVSKGAAPPEAINIMRQCWAEMPDMRPDFNSIYERFKVLNHGRKVNFVDTMFQMLEKYSNNLEELIRERTDQLDIERKKTEQLLNRMLPSSVAEKLKMGLCVEPEEFSDVTIYFSDIVGFTTIAAHCSPVQVVDLLNDLYTIFDATINAYNVYKVETIGDAYMVVSGLPVRIPNHAEEIATMALDLLHQSGSFKVKHLPGVPLQLRIGLHTGPCCAGVVGLTMPRYCLFGDTVNTASRMESTGSSWRIHMSEATRDRLEIAGGYQIESRGPIEIKGKGLMTTYWLLGKKGFEKLLPSPPPIGESHGLDESLIRNSITLKAQSNKSRNCSTNPSSSQSSSLAGESVEVKVEITPPIVITTQEPIAAVLPNSFSVDSNPTNISANLNLIPELPTKTLSASPQQRKLSELSQDGLLNPTNFSRTGGGSSSRLYKKIEEMMDLSSPYNHYKCLSPSESNLTQFSDGKYVYGNPKTDKPGSSRLLRRQFSLDKDDAPHQQQQNKQTLDIPILQEAKCSPTSLGRGTQLPRLHKQNSSSIAQDLEKIEEIPMSPASSQHHSSLGSLNRSPPTGSSKPGNNSPAENRRNRPQEIQLNVGALMTR